MRLGFGHGLNGGATLCQGGNHTVFHLNHGFIAAEPGDGLVLQAPGHDLGGQFCGAARQELHFGPAQGDAHCLVGGAQRLLGRDDIQTVEPGVGNGTTDGGVRRLGFSGIGGIHPGRLAGGGVHGPQIAVGLEIRGVVTAGPVENVRVMIPCHSTGHAGAVAVGRISVGTGVAGLRVVHGSQIRDSAVHSVGGLPGVQEAGVIAVGVVHSIEVTLVINGQGRQIASGPQAAGDVGVGEGQGVGQGQLAGDQVYGVQVVTAAQGIQLAIGIVHGQVADGIGDRGVAAHLFVVYPVALPGDIEVAVIGCNKDAAVNVLRRQDVQGRGFQSLQAIKIGGGCKVKLVRVDLHPGLGRDRACVGGKGVELTGIVRLLAVVVHFVVALILGAVLDYNDAGFPNGDSGQINHGADRCAGLGLLRLGLRQNPGAVFVQNGHGGQVLVIPGRHRQSAGGQILAHGLNLRSGVIQWWTRSRPGPAHRSPAAPKPGLCP